MGRKPDVWRTTANLNIMELFSGIQATKRAAIEFKNKNINSPVSFDFVGTCEWGVNEIINSAIIHKDLKEPNPLLLEYYGLNDAQEINKYLSNNIFSFNTEKPAKHILRLSDYHKKLLITSSILNKNISDIKQMNSYDIDARKPDLLTYSFPRQDLSTMNLTSNKGLNLENGRSSLVWEVIRILKNTIHKPAFLLMENVSAITNKQNINDFNSLIEKLSSIGYDSFYIKLNGLESGSIQHRPRVFMLSIRNDLNVPFSNNEEFNNYVLEIAKKYQNTPEEQEQKYKNAIFTSTEHFHEQLRAIIKDKRVKDGKSVFLDKKIIRLNPEYNKNFYVNTILKKSDLEYINKQYVVELDKSFQNFIDFKAENPSNYRNLTPRERFIFTGFRERDYEKIKEFQEHTHNSISTLNRQTGNSILVNVLVVLYDVISKLTELNKNNIVKSELNNDFNSLNAYINELINNINIKVKKQSSKLQNRWETLKSFYFETFAEIPEQKVKLKITRLKHFINKFHSFLSIFI